MLSLLRCAHLGAHSIGRRYHQSDYAMYSQLVTRPIVKHIYFHTLQLAGMFSLVYSPLLYNFSMPLAHVFNMLLQEGIVPLAGHGSSVVLCLQSTKTSVGPPDSARWWSGGLLESSETHLDIEQYFNN